jgi:hypothetical protein
MSPWGRSGAAQALEKQELERRGGDRRVRSRYRFLERRSGFDRREPEPPGSAGLVARSLARFRRSPRAFLFLLLTINLLNAADYASTLVALRLGFAEANPFMAELFAQGPGIAGLTKVSLVLLVTALLWALRRFKQAMLTALLVGAIMLGVFAYHLAGLGFWLAAT